MKKRSHFLSSCLFRIARILLALRYDVKVVGIDKISKEKSILFLPNHPAEIDPILLMAYLGPKYFPRPMVVEHFYRLKGFQWILDLIGVTPIPTMEEKANIWRGKEIARIFKDVSERMQAGDSFVIYPAGRLKASGRELIGGASFVHSLLQACPGIHVVLVRTSGLWGSSFSKAPTGRSPEFGKTLIANFFRLLKNGVFFIPKRTVLVEITDAPKDLPIHAPRLTFNKFLEEWYNQYPEPGPEPLHLVSYSCQKEQYVEMSNALSSGSHIDHPIDISVSAEVFSKVKSELASLAKVDPDSITLKMNLSTDLGLDSLDIANVHIFLDRKFDVVDFSPGDLQTVGDILRAIAGGIEKNDTSKVKEERSFKWPKESLRKHVRPPEGKTIQEAFLSSCDYMGRASAAADGSSGIITYKKMKIAALALADKLTLLPGEKIGIMLPSSLGSYITVLATLLANKIPVMLNWTAGVRGLDHASDLTQICHVLTSRLFLDKADLTSLGSIEPKLLYLEEIRYSITWKDKYRALWKSRKPAQRLLLELGLSMKAASDIAVILFTSGTESFPKAVPLSHENILFNQASAISCVKFKKTDCMYGVLPPFHSFGFSITGLMPILSGCRVFYAPDPNNTRGMVDDIRIVQPTIWCCAPSFIRAVFAIADPLALKSLRLIVSGAEKAVQIHDYISLNLPKTEFIEGYGITECSPVVTLCRPKEPLKGVGKPLPGVKLAIIDHETRARVSEGLEGEICIQGASVFSGYLSPTVQSPFIMLDASKWYVTGDVGYIDSQGNLHLTGRLKRFVKVGGEMISLGGLEEEIFHFAHGKGVFGAHCSATPLALTVKGKQSERSELILFSTVPLLREDINAFLKDAGWGRIIKIAEVRHLSEIPLTGVGKTDYRLLDEKYLSD